MKTLRGLERDIRRLTAPGRRKRAGRRRLERLKSCAVKREFREEKHA